MNWMTSAKKRIYKSKKDKDQQKRLTGKFKVNNPYKMGIEPSGAPVSIYEDQKFKKNHKSRERAENFYDARSLSIPSHQISEKKKKKGEKIMDPFDTVVCSPIGREDNVYEKDITIETGGSLPNDPIMPEKGEHEILFIDNGRVCTDISGDHNTTKAERKSTKEKKKDKENIRGRQVIEWTEDAGEINSNPIQEFPNADLFSTGKTDSKRILKPKGSSALSNVPHKMLKYSDNPTYPNINSDSVKSVGISQPDLQKKKSEITSMIKAWDLFDGNLPINVAETVSTKTDKSTKKSTNSMKKVSKISKPVEKHFICNYSYENVDVENDDLDVSYFL
jgi:hypothetical protein